MDAWTASLMALLAVPRYGLAGLFLVALISATLLPLGSEPALVGLVKLNPATLWPAVAVATLGNTLGGALTWWMGRGAARAYESVRHLQPHANDGSRAASWLRRFGPKACLLSWLPVIGDPLCAVAGWLALPFWRCVGYMAVGKGLRYLAVTAAVMQLFPGHFGR